MLNAATLTPGQSALARHRASERDSGGEEGGERMALVAFGPSGHNGFALVFFLALGPSDFLPLLLTAAEPGR